MEIPGAMDYGDSIIDGVESENVEEINDAYRDMIIELGTGWGRLVARPLYSVYTKSPSMHAYRDILSFSSNRHTK